MSGIRRSPLRSRQTFIPKLSRQNIEQTSFGRALRQHDENPYDHAKILAFQKSLLNAQIDFSQQLKQYPIYNNESFSNPQQMKKVRKSNDQNRVDICKNQNLMPQQLMVLKSLR